jgi:hypothetical protein
MCTVVAAALGAVGSIYQGMAANSAAKAQAQSAEYNAKIAEQQAEDAVKRAATEGLNMRRQGSILQGRQRAIAAASGVEVDSGSAQDIQEASMYEMERDIAQNAENRGREAWGYQVDATNYRNQASAARASGRNAMIGSVIGAAGNLLSLATPPASGGSKGIKINAHDKANAKLYKGVSTSSIYQNYGI